MQRDDRAKFHRRGKITAITICVLAMVVCLAGLIRIAHRYDRPNRPRVWCESYSPGHEPRGCGASDMAAWKDLGLKPAPGSGLPKP